jgi:hypothetical protein
MLQGPRTRAPSCLVGDGRPLGLPPYYAFVRTLWGSFSAKASASAVLALGVAAGCKASPPSTETGVASARVTPGAASAPSAGADLVTWPVEQGIGPAHAIPQAAYVAGANETEALIEFSRLPRAHGFFGVVELASGCLRETQPGLDLIGPPPLATKGGRPPEAWIETLQSREGQAELQRALGLMRQIGGGRLKHVVEIAADAAGRTVLFRGEEQVFRSIDSGATFKLADNSTETVSFTPAVSADGRFSAFVRCRPFCERRELAVIDRSGPPKPRGALRSGSIIALDPEGRYAYVERTAGATQGPAQQLCIDRVPFEGGPSETLRCFSASRVETKWGLIPNAPPGAGVSYQLPLIVDVSPGVRYALLSLSTPIEGNATRFEVVSLRDGRSVDSVEAYDHDAVVDDRGYVAFDPDILRRLRAYTPAGAPPLDPQPDAPVRVLAGGTTRDVTTGRVAGWAPGGRLLVFDALAAAARSRCGTIKVVPIAGPLPRARPPHTDAQPSPRAAGPARSSNVDLYARRQASRSVAAAFLSMRAAPRLLRFWACVLQRHRPIRFVACVLQRQPSICVLACVLQRHHSIQLWHASCGGSICYDCPQRFCKIICFTYYPQCTTLLLRRRALAPWRGGSSSLAHKSALAVAPTAARTWGLTR